VSHKEKIKHLRSNVDVLTMTATPIPRTLQMSLGGIRDLSVIEPSCGTAGDPYVRHRVRRGGHSRRDPPGTPAGGQVFFVHNRVQSIQAMETFLRRLVPEARIGVAHGQMVEKDLERVMLAFVKKDVEVS